MDLVQALLVSGRILEIALLIPIVLFMIVKFFTNFMTYNSTQRVFCVLATAFVILRFTNSGLSIAMLPYFELPAEILATFERITEHFGTVCFFALFFTNSILWAEMMHLAHGRSYANISAQLKWPKIVILALNLALVVLQITFYLWFYNQAFSNDLFDEAEGVYFLALSLGTLIYFVLWTLYHKHSLWTGFKIDDPHKRTIVRTLFRVAIYFWIVLMLHSISRVIPFTISKFNHEQQQRQHDSSRSTATDSRILPHRMNKSAVRIFITSSGTDSASLPIFEGLNIAETLLLDIIPLSIIVYVMMRSGLHNNEDRTPALLLEPQQQQEPSTETQRSSNERTLLFPGSRQQFRSNQSLATIGDSGGEISIAPEMITTTAIGGVSDSDIIQNYFVESDEDNIVYTYEVPTPAKKPPETIGKRTF